MPHFNFFVVIKENKLITKRKRVFQTEIIEKCKQNNRLAQMQLYDQYCNGMYIVANRFVKDTAEAEDIVQDAFIKAFTKLHQYKAEVTFGAWLKRIVINKSIDFLKSKKQQLVALEDVHLKEIGRASRRERVSVGV